MIKTKSKPMKVIGIHEKISLPKYEINALPSKTDTGAYNCSIDCCFTEEIANSKGSKVLRFILLNPKNPHYTGKVYRTKKYKSKTVRSSNGSETQRYQIKFKITLKDQTFKTTFNLSNRSKMRYPVLLGRKSLAKRFLVDVSMNRKTVKNQAERP